MRQNEDLTIGELSKMNAISTHQVRFYEEKGIFKPAYIDENGYRKYDLDSMYQITHVLVLRKMNIPVGKIKKAMEEDSSIYIEEIQKSIKSLRSQIEELESKISFSESILDQAFELRKAIGKFEEVFYQESHYGSILSYTFDDLPSPKEVYQGYINHGIISYHHPLTTFLVDGKLHIGIKNFKGTRRFTIQKGKYLRYVSSISGFEELPKVAETFFSYVLEHDVKISDQLIIREECCNTFISQNVDVIIFEAKILS